MSGEMARDGNGIGLGMESREGEGRKGEGRKEIF
jgi:hypothetical protein